MGTKISGIDRLRRIQDSIPTTASDLRPALISGLLLETQRQQAQIPYKTGRLRSSLVSPSDPYHLSFSTPSGAGLWSSLPYADRYADRIPKPRPEALSGYLQADLARRLAQ